ncbi:hypothetical protein GCM10023192_88620 [Amycolatopsis samaneae]
MPAGELVLERDMPVHPLAIDALDSVQGGIIEAVGSGAGQQVLLFGCAPWGKSPRLPLVKRLPAKRQPPKWYRTNEFSCRTAIRIPGSDSVVR